MRDYECYFLNEEHHFRDVEFLTEVDDGAAIATSQRLFAVRVDCAGLVWEREGFSLLEDATEQSSVSRFTGAMWPSLAGACS
jgi:hypothetical protein